VIQIYPSEIAGVPSTIETSDPDRSFNFYDIQNVIDYPAKAYDYDALHTANRVGDCRNINNDNESFESCGHLIPEVWNGQFLNVKKLETERVIEPSEATGGVGKMNWYIPKFLAIEDPTLASWFGLSGEKNRKRLANNFKRPTNWIDYCLLVSKDNCTTNDAISARHPENEEEGNKYFVEGLFKGYFRKTENNDCITHPDNCTGHIVNNQCDWSTFVVQQAYHLDIFVESNGPLVPNNGYGYSNSIEIWRAANATKSAVIFSWWTPDILPLEFLGTDAEFQPILLPPATLKCVKSRVSEEERCSLEKKVQVGSADGACTSETHAYQKLIVANLKENTYKVPTARRSPGYDAVKAFQISDLDVDELMRAWLNGTSSNKNYNARDAVCNWVGKNYDNLVSLLPPTYPRSIEPFLWNYDSPIFITSMFFSILASSIILYTFICVYKNRKKKVIKVAQVHFLFLTLLGLGLISISSILYNFEPFKVTCILSVWLYILGYTLELVSLIIKVSAINKTFQAAKEMRRVEVDNKRMFIEVIVMIFITFIFLVLWTWLDPFVPKEILELDGSIITITYQCESNSIIWVIVGLFAWKTLLLICALVLAFLTRNVIKAFNESHKLAIMTYNHVFFMIVSFMCYASKKYLSYNLVRGLTSISFSFDIIMTILIYFVPKLQSVHDKKRLSVNMISFVSSHLNDASHISDINNKESNDMKPRIGGEGNTLLLINIQNDFYSGGSLEVQNAGRNEKSTAAYIKNNTFDIDRIIVLTNERQKNHITHPTFWVEVGKENESIHPQPFTLIETSDIGVKWKPRDINMKMYALNESLSYDEYLWDSEGNFNMTNYAIKYTTFLKENKKSPLIIWPEHCLAGCNGVHIQTEIRNALNIWERCTGKAVQFQVKTDHMLTESYSALRAEFPVDKRTLFDRELYNDLLKSDKLIIIGESSSHCINFTIRDLIELWPKEAMSKIILLEDCMSPIPNHVDLATKFFEDVDEIGVTILCSDDSIFI